MRKILTTAAAVALVGATSYADLQNVEVGGSIRIRGNSFFGGSGTLLDGDKANQFTEQRTALTVKADFSDDVSAFIELDAFNIWGDSPRDFIANGTNFLNGGGFTGNGEVSLYQGYIELDQAFGRNINTKIGRQEVQFGSEWLIGNNDTAGIYTGLSFDGIVSELFTANDAHSLSIINLKVLEGDIGTGANDRDADLRGLYYTYSGREDMVIDAYALHVRIGLPGGGDNTDILTLGARIAGDWNAVDYELEIAHQSGDTGAAAGVTDADGIAGNLEVGYTFDSNYAPRVFIGAAFFEGPDSSDSGFNRLWSDWEYSEFLSNANLDNALILRLGGSLQATEKIELSGVVSMFEQDEESAAAPLRAGDTSEDELGLEVGLYATYAYSEDVAIEVGYAHFFTGDVYEGTGVNEDDADYVYAEISVSF